MKLLSYVLDSFASIRDLGVSLVGEISYVSVFINLRASNIWIKNNNMIFFYFFQYILIF